MDPRLLTWNGTEEASIKFVRGGRKGLDIGINGVSLANGEGSGGGDEEKDVLDYDDFGGLSGLRI
jgi:hypothetical protein